MSYGLIGLGTMGSNLALNISRKNKLHVYNRSYDKVEATIKRNTNLEGHKTISEMVQNMKTPRIIISMLPHGKPSHDTISNTVKLMDPGDTIIDCANEHYMESVNRENICDKYDISYLGTGMSGGAKGALNGPAIMIGGHSSSYQQNQDFLESFCKNVVHVDDLPDSGHFTKMVHNGIEYAMLQAIADVYAYLNYDPDQMNVLLQRCCNEDSILYGYLIHSAVHVLDTYDIENISDIAHMNDTGLWCVEYAYTHGLNVPTMHSAVQARYTSKEQKDKSKQRTNTNVNIDAAYDMLRFVFALAVLEGISLIQHKQISLNKARKAWSKATIIECPMVTYETTKLQKVTNESVYKARIVLLECVRNSVPVPSLSAGIQYHDFINQGKTQMSFLMAQRNYFGQHAIKVNG